MTFEAAVKTCLSKCGEFDGRASRAEFWWFQLFLALMHVVAMVLRALLSRVSAISYNGLDKDIVAAGGGALAPWGGSAGAYAASLVPLLLFAVFIVPNLSVWVRRMHDVDCKFSNKLMLYSFVSIIFVIYIAYQSYNMCQSPGACGFVLIFFVGFNMPFLFISACCIMTMIYFLLEPSDPCENTYGPAPHDDLTRR